MIVRGMLLLLVAPCVFCFHPVIIVPGDLGSQMEARLDKKETNHWYCAKESDWYQIWVNPGMMIGPQLHCWADNFKLEFKEGQFFNAPGVETRAKDFGGLSGIAYLDNFHAIKYFEPLIEALLLLPGAKAGLNVRGAPYDFRYTPPSNENTLYYNQLKGLVEETYALNNGTKIVLIAHSMGNNILTVFLNTQSNDWKDQYIEAYAAIAGPLGGALASIKGLTSGEREHIPGFIIDSIALRDHGRTIQSNYWLLPRQPFWNSTEVVVQTHNRNYTVDDFEEMFSDMGYNIGAEMYAVVKDPPHLTDDPGVKTFCFNGKDVATPAGYAWTGSLYFPDDDPVEIEGNGDGTVPYRSLQVCHGWKSTYSVHEYSGESHFYILRNEDMLDIIGNYIVNGLI